MRVGRVPEAEGTSRMSAGAPGHGEIPAHVYRPQPASASLLPILRDTTTVMPGTNPAWAAGGLTLIWEG